MLSIFDPYYSTFVYVVYLYSCWNGKFVIARISLSNPVSSLRPGSTPWIHVFNFMQLDAFSCIVLPKVCSRTKDGHVNDERNWNDVSLLKQNGPLCAHHQSRRPKRSLLILPCRPAWLHTWIRKVSFGFSFKTCRKIDKLETKKYRFRDYEL
jgi:hypothetical protein